MKKQIKKLSLNKRTISNLSTTEMGKQLGGGPMNNGLTRNRTCIFFCTPRECYTYNGPTCNHKCGY